MYIIVVILLVAFCSFAIFVGLYNYYAARIDLEMPRMCWFIFEDLTERGYPPFLGVIALALIYRRGELEMQLRSDCHPDDVVGLSESDPEIDELTFGQVRRYYKFRLRSDPEQGRKPPKERNGREHTLRLRPA